jgi:High potential iron-sulfur protein
MRERTLNSKRNFIRLIFLGVVALVGTPQKSLASDEKQSKQAAEYQVNPKGIQMCATCTLFVAPRSCKVVEGDISPNGWCKVYAMAD